MSFFSSGLIQQLEQTFHANALTIEVVEDHFEVINSQTETIEKIRAIIETKKYCPLISEERHNGNLEFTVTPHAFSALFRTRAYLTKKEITSQLNDKEFGLNTLKQFDDRPAAIIDGKYFDQNQEVLQMRSFVRISLNLALNDILTKLAKDGKPLVEIGTGGGYDLTRSLAARTIRIQPSQADCTLFKAQSCDPIYQLKFEEFHEKLQKTGKKISLIFGFNVFDTMKDEARKANLARISELQNPGDRLLIISDLNPLIQNILIELKRMHPDDVFIPYFPTNQFHYKFSLLRIPSKIYGRDLSISEHLYKIAGKKTNESVEQEQTQLQRWQKEHDLEVIPIEDFFAKLMTEELSKIGYGAKVYYHARFARVCDPSILGNLKEDLIYKSVSGLKPIQTCLLDDEQFLAMLTSKKIDGVSEFTNEYIQNLRRQGGKLSAAEILVIEGTKL